MVPHHGAMRAGSLFFIRAKSRRNGPAEARGLGERQRLRVTLAGEPLPAVGGFVLAEAFPELLGEEVP